MDIDDPTISYDRTIKHLFSDKVYFGLGYNPDELFSGPLSDQTKSVADMAAAIGHLLGEPHALAQSHATSDCPSLKQLRVLSQILVTGASTVGIAPRWLSRASVSDEEIDRANQDCFEVLTRAPIPSSASVLQKESVRCAKSAMSGLAVLPRAIKTRVLREMWPYLLKACPDR
ncbi:hypothetical protein H9P43_006826 [Blastocladiella emersonii ATCC 22665]|nr:hypothetical protein H9P43_006826 [Blastocladiella emersonii ATCC 22665]